MKPDILKSIDRVLTVERKRRPALEEYESLMNRSEQEFVARFIDLVANALPENFRLAVTLMGSLSRYFDHHALQLLGIRRIPHDIDLVFTAEKEGGDLSLNEREAALGVTLPLISAFLDRQGFNFEINRTTSPFSPKTTSSIQFLTETRNEPNTEDRTRPFDLLFFNFLLNGSTWDIDNLGREHRSRGIRLLDQRNSIFVLKDDAQRSERAEAARDMQDAYLKS